MRCVLRDVHAPVPMPALRLIDNAHAAMKRTTDAHAPTISMKKILSAYGWPGSGKKYGSYKTTIPAGFPA